MGRPGSVQLARVFGIRVGADYSWFIVLFLAIFFAREQFAELTRESDSTVFIAAVVEAFLFFGSIIVHEMGHALVARREGIDVAGIDLFLFGGLMHMRSEPETPGAEFRVAAAGPAATLLIIVVASAAGLLAGNPDEFKDAITLTGTVELVPLMIASVALINLVVLVFNLIPAYPLDGGRIARAAVWRITGDRHRGTRAAAAIGRAFGSLLVLGGLLLLFNGATFDGIYMAFLGWLLGSQARNVAVQSVVSERLESITVAELMDANPVAIPADTAAQRAYEDYFLRYGYDWFVVTEADGAYIGRAYREPIRQASDTGRPVRELVVVEDDMVPEDTTLHGLLRANALRDNRSLVAVDGEGRLRGILTPEQIQRALRARLAPGAT